MMPRISIGIVVVALANAAGQPLPELRTEPATGGSIFYVRNIASQPVTAFLIELVNYPGSSYALFEDEAATVLIAPNTGKRIQVTNMTVGAVPDYVKLTAAIFADGSSAGIPEKIAEIVERRRFVLATMRELIARIDKARVQPTSKTALLADLKRWADSFQPAGKTDRNSQTAINQMAARGVINDFIASLDTQPPDETFGKFKAAERSLAGSKPPL